MSDSIETEDQLLARHRKENRDFIATITGLKKQATKSKKKEVQKRCTEMEQDLKLKHEKELKEFKSGGGGGVIDGADEANEANDEDEEDEDELTPEKLLAQLELEKKEEEASKPQPKLQEQQPQQKGPKRNRQKERLAKRQAALDEQRREAEKEANLQPDLKKIEDENIKSLCSVAKVKEFDIKPDGNCLFSSISDQLKIRQGIDASIQHLRTLAATHIRNDPETFLPYLFDEETMSLKNIDEYTEKIEKTACWGSDLEILALAKEYNSPISVMMSGRSTLKINKEGHNEELKLVYYKHSYALGEHYNSLHDL